MELKFKRYANSHYDDQFCVRSIDLRVLGDAGLLISFASFSMCCVCRGQNVDRASGSPMLPPQLHSASLTASSAPSSPDKASLIMLTVLSRLRLLLLGLDVLVVPKLEVLE